MGVSIMRGWIVRAAAVLAMLVLVVGAWGVSRGLHYAVYEAALLPVVAHRIAADAHTPEKATQRSTNSST